MENTTETSLPMTDKDIQKSLEPISFFDKDADFVYIFKKTEKLTTAVYMVTNLFSDNETIKWTLRKKVSDFLSYILGYKDTFASERQRFVLVAKTEVLGIMSFLEVSASAGLLSPMNFSILKQEFGNLVSSLESSCKHENVSSTVVFPQSFFDISRPLPPHKISVKEEYVSHISPKLIKDIGMLGGKAVFKKNNRQNIILQMLKKKNNLTVKDISEIIKDCSEKTIQRELIDLIDAGVIRKTGERRWSRYSISA